MDTDITLIATAYALARIAVIAAIGYLLYRYVVSSRPNRVPVRSRSNYAQERYESTRSIR